MSPTQHDRNINVYRRTNDRKTINNWSNNYCCYNTRFDQNARYRIAHNITPRAKMGTWVKQVGDLAVGFVPGPFVDFRLSGRRITVEIKAPHFGVQVFTSPIHVIYA